MDLEFLIRVVLGLLAISIGADSIAGGMEAGVLRALLAQPLAASTVFIAKVTGGIAALLCSLLAVATTVGVTLALVAHDFWYPGFLGVVVMFLIASCAYLLSMFVLGMLVTLFSSSGTATTITTTSLWLLIAVAGVPAIGFIASAAAPVPSREVTYSRRQAVYDAAVRRSEDSLGTLLQKVAGAPETWRQQQLPEAARTQLEAGWRAQGPPIREQVRAIDAQYDAAVRRRRRMVQALSLLNPASQFLEAAFCIAGTGTPTAERLDRAVSNYQQLLDEQLFFDPPRLTVRVPADRGVAIVSYSRRPPPTAAQLPTLIPPSSDLSVALRDSLKPFLVLCGYAGALTLAATVTFQRRSTDLLTDRRQLDRS